MIGITERGDAALDLSWKPWVKSGKPAILITKDPLRLIPNLSNDMNVIVHATVTGLPKAIEPNTPHYEDAIAGLKIIQNVLGKERTVLRVDPIICDCYDRALAIIDYAKQQDLIYRLRISFLDLYPHVKVRFGTIGYYVNQDFHADYSTRWRIFNLVKNMFPEVEVCGEPDLPCSGCISAKDLEILMCEDCSTFGNQRKHCNCLSVKKELLSNKHPCDHGCFYCYWKDR